MIATLLRTTWDECGSIEQTVKLRRVFSETKLWLCIQQEMRLVTADREGFRQAAGRGYGDYLHALCCYLAEGHAPVSEGDGTVYRSREIYECLRDVKNTTIQFVKNQQD